MPADFLSKQGDAAPIMSDTLTYSDGTVPSLQGATVQFKARAATSLAPVSLAGTTSVVNANTGAVQFAPTAADTATAGMYLCNWLVTLQGGAQVTFPTSGYLWWSIEPSLSGIPQQIVDLPTVKEHLRIPSGERGRDDELQRLITTITPLIEEQTGPIIPRVFEEWHDGGSNMIQLLRYPSSAFGTKPVLQLLAASEYRGPIEYPLAQVASPVYGSIYSVFLDADSGTLTRRTAGGRTLPFMPGRQSVHVFYYSGQLSTPPNVAFAALEAVRIAFEWTQPVGRNRRTIGDEQEIGPGLQFTLSRTIRMMLTPTRRAPSFA